MLLLLFFPFTGFCQICDSIRMTKTEYPEIIVVAPNKLNTEIYSKIKSWINRTYKNPEVVIKADELNNYIRISAIDNYTFQYMGASTYSLSYDLEINIKDNKYKIQFINVKSPELRTPNMPQTFFDSKGEIKGIKKINLKMQKAVLFTLNQINFDLYNFIFKKTAEW